MIKQKTMPSTLLLLAYCSCNRTFTDAGDISACIITRAVPGLTGPVIHGFSLGLRVNEAMEAVVEGVNLVDNDDDNETVDIDSSPPPVAVASSVVG